LLTGLIFPIRNLWAYRPFISTDSTVADPGELEIELGYFELDRIKGENTWIVPHIVFNYGIVHRLEAVGEFKVALSNDEGTQIIDSSLSLKAVLQEKYPSKGENGVSVAMEVASLLPSTVRGERKFGFEGIVILGATFSPFTFYLNVGGGVNREETNPFAVWGLIGEVALHPRFRLVGEMDGEVIHGEPTEASALLGVIWKSPWPNTFFDAGIRRGTFGGFEGWQFTAGLTVGFSLRSHDIGR
jgi:hypothetical protein